MRIYLSIVLLIVSCSVKGQLQSVRLIPELGLSEGFFSYTKPIHKLIHVRKRLDSNPFSPVDVNFSFKAECGFKKFDLGIGIGNGSADYSYQFFMGSEKFINSQGNLVQVTTYMGHKYRWPVSKIPVYIRFPLPLNRGTINTTEIKRFTRPRRWSYCSTASLGLTLLKLRTVSSYSDTALYWANRVYNDTVYLVSIPKDLNKYGASLTMGLSLSAIKKGRERIRFQLSWEQGLVPLYELFIYYYINQDLKYQNSILARGTAFYFGFAFPITYRIKRKHQLMQFFL